VEDTGLHPLLEAVMGRGTRTKAGGVQRLPLTASTEHEQNGFHTDAVWRPRAATPIGMRIHMLGQQQGDGFPEIIGDTPLVDDGNI
jgi:hypothetical protein